MEPGLYAPRHFHLLWDDDIDRLQDIFRAILERTGEIVRHWYQLYVLHFGDARSLSQAEFTRIFEPGLRRSKIALLQRDMDLYAAQVISLGEALAERRVPLEEIIASLHLFEESAYTVFPPETPTELYTSFDKLSHVRIILLVSAYFRSHSAAAGERIAALEREAGRLSQENRTRFRGLVGGSPAMRRLYSRIEAAAAAGADILIAGEKGTGKELIARAIHESARGERGAFVAVNCSAIPASLIDTELFGYRRDAVKGAPADYLGLARSAEGGTLFVDEICGLTPKIQDALLHVVCEGKVRPAGTAEDYPVNFRLIAATSRDPSAAMAQGQLRAALMHRFEGSVIDVPPLRQRTEDIPALAEHFIAVFRERSGRRVFGISDDALDTLLGFYWPGNVRELADVIEAAFRVSSEHAIGAADLPPLSDAGELAPSGGAAMMQGSQIRIGSFAELERDLIRRALESTRGNKARTAKLLKISRKKLYSRIKKFDLE
jgi:DNA-binding NtrC family response regulator